MKHPVTVIKRNIKGEETWRYPGFLTRRRGSALYIEASFNGPEAQFMGTFIRTGDRFFETYYLDRWYNIFEIHDRESGALKGWYCNVGFPAVQEAPGVISFVDLALDLWVSPDGTQKVLDEDEFASLDMPGETREAAGKALQELQAMFAQKKDPAHF